MAFRLEVYERTTCSVKAEWLFGLAKQELLKKRETKPKGVKDKGYNKKLIGMLNTEGLLSQIKILATDLFNSLNIILLRIDCMIGLDNPADIGLLYAFIEPANVFFRQPERYKISITPLLQDEVTLEGYIQAKVRLLPIRLIIPLFKFVFSRPNLKATKTAIFKK